jgi:hypothetical protein
MRRRWIGVLALLVVGASGCTSGAVVDESFKLESLDVPFVFVAVDGRGQPTGETYTWTPPPTSGSPWISFDPFAPGGPNANGKGVSNTPTEVPPGDYYVYALAPVPGGFGALVSPVFHHDFYISTTDQITGQANVPSAVYWFQTHFGCSSWQCATGSSTPPSQTNSGYRVIPMIVVYESGPGQPGPAGKMQNNW